MDKVEGYIKWIHELAQESIKKGSTLEAYLKGFLESRKQQRHANSESFFKVGSHEGAKSNASTEHEHVSLNSGGSNNSWKDATNALTRMLSSAAIYIITGKKASAMFLLIEVGKIVENFTDADDPQCKVILHCKDVLWWQYYGTEEDKDMPLKFNAKWAELVGQSYEGEATVYFLKGMLALKMDINEEKIKDFFWTATLLDPKCLIWQHIAYRSFRRIRRNGGFYGAPSDKERELARTAYELSGGEHMLVAADYALMLKEVMWPKRHDQGVWDQSFQIFMDCVLVYETVLVMAKGTSLYTRIKLHFAELMFYGRGPSAAKMRGKQLFAELEKESSDDQFVLHKLGNAYREEGKLELASDCYKRALTLSPTFVPCIMDYQRLLRRTNDDNEILMVINKALSPELQRSDKETARLQMERDLALAEMRKRWYSAAELDDNWRRRN